MGNRQRKPKTDKHAVGAGFKPASTAGFDSHAHSIVGAGFKPAPTRPAPCGGFRFMHVFHCRGGFQTRLYDGFDFTGGFQTRLQHE